MRPARKRVYARKQGGRVLHEMMGKAFGGFVSRCGLVYPEKAWTRMRRGRPRRELCKNCERKAAKPLQAIRRGWRGGRRR